MALKINPKKTVVVTTSIEKLPHDGLLPDTAALPNALSKVVVAPQVPCTTKGGASTGTTSLQRIEPDGEEGMTVESRLKRKRLSLIGKHLPRLHCNNCVATDRCPKHKAGYECAYADDMLKRISGVKDARSLMVAIAEAAVSRAQQAVIMESMSGGTLSATTDTALDSAFAKLQTVHDMLGEKGPDAGGKPTGIIEALFGRMLVQTVQVKPVIDVSSKEVKPD